jgi:hypothetical protein
MDACVRERARLFCVEWAPREARSLRAVREVFAAGACGTVRYGRVGKRHWACLFPSLCGIVGGVRMGVCVCRVCSRSRTLARGVGGLWVRHHATVPSVPVRAVSRRVAPPSTLGPCRVCPASDTDARICAF